jgi:uncharacterized protein YbjT (DUF2867 family)
MAKIMIIGATGTVGKAVSELLAPDYDIVRVGNSRGDDPVDLASKASIEALMSQTVIRDFERLNSWTVPAEYNFHSRSEFLLWR